ncbi:bifunctional DNA primase/polymerase [Sporosarcina sp. USHLN248]|uniref:bifunctional DNA primase/polymerase n=1 Tax=Sporosarcina sp. USHLN248 TaxID=3081300 RepID=UPI00301A764B
MLKAAIGYAEHMNWSVFPVHWLKNGRCSCNDPKCPHVAKHPITWNGLKDATRDIAVINEWWQLYPDANIGVLTGKESGIFVLDVDTDKKEKIDGYVTLEELTKIHGPLPNTPMAITGSLGTHYVFQYHEGIRNRIDFLPSLDIRGQGGYFIAPPSLHYSGRRYTWELSGHPLQVNISAAPQWLIQLITTSVGEIIKQPTGHWQRLVKGLKEGEGRNCEYRC